MIAKQRHAFVVTSNELDVLQQVSTCDPSQTQSSLLVNVDAICRNYVQWALCLPRVDLSFPVRFNKDPVLLGMLCALGAGFSCVNKREIESLLKLAIPSRRILFGNAYKLRSHLQYAKEVNVDLTVFCSSAELEKIGKLHPKSRLLLKIAHSVDVHPFDVDYGAQVDEAVGLLKIARRLNLSVIGVCFNCCKTVEPLRTRLERIKSLFTAAAVVGFEMHVINLECCPMPGNEALELTDLLDELFPSDDYPELTIMGEANELYASAAFTLCSPVLQVNSNGENVMVGGREFGATLDAGKLPTPIPVRRQSDGRWTAVAGDNVYSVMAEENRLTVTVAGRMRPGDVLIWPRFNCPPLDTANISYFCSHDLWKTLDCLRREGETVGGCVA